MANELLYGEQLLALAPDNTSGLITASTLRSLVVSQRSGGGQVLGSTTFTVPVTNGVPVAINPLIVGATHGGVLWKADGNNRQYPDYQNAIPDITMVAGYSKLAQVFFTFAAQKAGSGEDTYRFQLDNNGTPIGTGVEYTLSTEPTVVSLLVNASVTLDGGALLGLTVTGVGTGDDIDITAFEQFVIDFQRWAAP